MIELLEINSTRSARNSTEKCAQFAYYEQVSEAGCENLDLSAKDKVFEWVSHL